jgi:hypothetical protein
MRNKLLTILSCLMCGFSANASIVINEIMQSNVDCLFIDHDFPDSWVELYNNGTSVVSLTGWGFGETDNYADAWILNNTLYIPAKGFATIYLDKEDTGLHANFKLDSGSSALYVFDRSGAVVDKISFKKQPAPNISYGREYDGANSWAYFTSATPGSTNNAANTITDKSNLLPEPSFNADGFVSVKGKDAFTLSVTIPDGVPADTKLCITTDGSEPTAANAVSTKTWTKYISSTTVVRAKLLSENALPIRSTTQSYIYLPEATQLSVFSLVGNPDYFYSDDEGILMGEWDDNDASKQNPNWNHDWRRPINIEYFQGADHVLLFNQVGETRVHGNYTRRNAQKSLAVYANKRFGTKKFNGSLWHEKENVTAVKSFVLRNGGNCFEASRINDQVGQSAIGRYVHDLDWQAYEPAIYFLNGKYMGIADLRERSNDDNIEANYGIDDIDMIENWEELKTGTWDNYNEFVEYCNSSSVTYEGLSQRMDIDNFLNMFIIKSFGMDTDFPNNNITVWRSREDGGKWRFMLKDIDRMGLQWMNDEIGNDLCDFINDMFNWGSFWKKNLRVFKLIYSDIPEARDLYIDRMAIYLGDFLRTEKGQDLIDEYVSAIEPEYLRHLQVYFNDVYSTSSYRYCGDWGWQGYVKYFRNTWWSKRKSNMFNLLRSRYSLGSIVTLNMERNENPVNFNGVDLTYDKYYGKWFVGREIRLNTLPGHQYRITTVSTSNKTTTTDVLKNYLSYTPAADVSSIKIEVLNNDNAVNDITADTAGINVSRQGNEIIINSEAPMQSIAVYGSDGRLFANTTNLNGALTHTLTTPTPAVRILVITTSLGTTTLKI